MNELWLIRHAETEWAKAGRHTGRTDIPLTDDGRAAARALRPRVADHPFTAVFVSPLSRARDLDRTGQGPPAGHHQAIHRSTLRRGCAHVSIPEVRRASAMRVLPARSKRTRASS